MTGGVTGHRHFQSADAEAWAKGTLAKTVLDNDIDYGFTCLAEGADQMFAEIMADLSVPYTVIIPCDNYEATFTEKQGVERFIRLVKASRHTTRLAFPSPSDEAFLSASRRLVDSVSVLFAVWDGEPSRGTGGTADVIQYAVECGKHVIHVNPVARIVSDWAVRDHP
jgi:hypothetical protein